MNNSWNIRFLIRSASLDDLNDLYELSLNNDLLNLPTDKDILYKKINDSIASFACEKHVDERQFIFVLEDQETKKVTGTSTIFSDYANDEHPLYFFKVYDSSNPPEGSNIQNGHQILRLCKETNGISAIGGLVVDSRYRGLPDKRGKQISLIRFVFLGMFIDFFHATILSELKAPMASDATNPFWNAIGKKYTKLDYESVFQSARLKDRSFIEDHFPKEDIILSPDKKHIHRTIHSVNDASLAQQHMIIQQGFKYLQRVDPMDGGLQYFARTNTIKSIKNGKYYYCDQITDTKNLSQSMLIGSVRSGRFSGCQVPVSVQGKTILLPGHAMKSVHLSPGDEVYASPI